MLTLLTPSIPMPTPCLLPGPTRACPLRFRETLSAAITIAVPDSASAISRSRTYDPDSVIVVGFVTGRTPEPSWGVTPRDKEAPVEAKYAGKVDGVAKLRIAPPPENFSDSAGEVGPFAEIVFWMNVPSTNREA